MLIQNTDLVSGPLFYTSTSLPLLLGAGAEPEDPGGEQEQGHATGVPALPGGGAGGRVC